ncbi:MAG TPA: phosphoribosylanthranilate isomerase [Myxococcales bacterium]|jgi:phosphoribosylanthranilate isomerase|nr:phosphoribosylanthranilate isomerase [Myxococcales bacterium]
MSGRIKLCGMRTVEDAVFCAEAGADELGVIFADRSKRKVSVEMAAAIRQAVKVPVVGVFLDAPLDEVLKTIRVAGLHAAQLHGNWSTSDLFPFYAALQVTGIESLQPRPGASRILLDGPAGGSGKSFAWALAAEARKLYQAPLYIAGGLTAENVGEAIRQARPDGVDVSSGIENELGFKSKERVRAFVSAAKEAFQ